MTFCTRSACEQHLTANVCAEDGLGRGEGRVRKAAATRVRYDVVYSMVSALLVRVQGIIIVSCKTHALSGSVRAVCSVTNV